MEPALQLKIQHYGWNQAASYYDPLWEKQLKSSQDLLLLMAELEEGERVLDVACGSGLATFPAARAVGFTGSIAATDISESMLEIARIRAEKYRLGNIKFQQMNAENLTLPDESFDVSMCSLGLMYLPDPLQAVREMYRVLKPGGRALALVWGRRKHCGWADIFPIVDQHVTTDVCPLFFQQGTGHTLRSTFEMCGFTETEEKRFSTIIHHDSAEDAANAMFIGGPVALAWKQFDEKTKKAAYEAYIDSLEEFKDGEGYDVPGEFVIVKGSKNTVN
ncbi:MAG TPA: class I SAM-dependent methyltransferase [Balneolaceae bacterium]|nr:class I SAM-dependent methyltransferase [Balneolaceae bacterium]